MRGFPSLVELLVLLGGVVVVGGGGLFAFAWLLQYSGAGDELATAAEAFAFGASVIVVGLMAVSAVLFLFWVIFEVFVP